MLTTSFNILAICGAAGFAGTMLCIGVTLGGYWKSQPPDEFLDWFAQNNHFVARTVPMIVLPTLIGLAGSLWSSWFAQGFAWWVVSCLCLLTVLVLTAMYFVPSNTAFARGAVTPDLVPNKLNQWVQVHYLRIVLAMASAVLGILATIEQAALS
jgi:hypothetical protein